MIRHISLDFWNTLAIANPEFAKKRFQILALYTGHTMAEVEHLYKEVKKDLDIDAAKGIGHKTYDNYLKLMKLITDKWIFDDARLLAVNMNLLFYRHPPTIPDDVVVELKRLNQKGITLSIASNTNFIAGAFLKQTVLDPLGVDIAFMLFSDELGITKPNPLFFEEIIACTMGHYILRTFEPMAVSASEICHIGDSNTYDLPAVASGMMVKIIDNPRELANILKQF